MSATGSNSNYWPLGGSISAVRADNRSLREFYCGAAKTFVSSYKHLWLLTVDPDSYRDRKPHWANSQNASSKPLTDDMKKIFALLIGLTFGSCSSRQDQIDFSNSRPRQSAELTFFMDKLKNSDSIAFPDHYTIIEENDSIKDGLGLHNACIKLTHADILKFINDNKLNLPHATEKISPKVFMLLKECPDIAKTYEREINGKTGGLFADTTSNKLYISLFY